MSTPVPPEVGPPDPGRVGTRQDFARELTLLREQAGLTVRQVASKVGVQRAHSTIGDWFAGRGLPSMASRDLLVRVLAVCGVSDVGLVEQWLQAWRRVRRAPGLRAGALEPYRGLASFQLEDAGWFFGRRALTGQLLARLADLHAAGGGVQVGVGASGSGKSSLLRAGLIPVLHAGGVAGSARWTVVLLTPGSRPVEELAAKLAALTGGPASEIAEAMQADPARCSGYARQAAASTVGQSAGGDPSPVDTGQSGIADSAEDHQLVLVVDQFEEVFTTCADSREQRLFIAALCAAMTEPGGALVVLGLRADFYAHALRYPQLVAAVQSNQLAVGPMNEAELREVIVEPARKAKIDIEDGLVELLLRDVAPRDGNQAAEQAHEAGALPLLSHALYATWRHGQGRRLTIASYRDMGGIAGAVATSANKVYDELTEQQQRLARRLFLSLVHIAADTVGTRRRITVTELLADHDDAQAAEMEDVLNRFVVQRLITADTDTHRETSTVEISHDALLTAWPQLRAWLDADRAGLLIARQLTEDAAAWDRNHEDSSLLYRGSRLEFAQAWAATALPGDLSPTAHAFLATSTRQQRRSKRRRNATVIVLAVLALVASTAAVVALQQQREARSQRDLAIYNRVVAKADRLRGTDVSLSAQLNLVAHRMRPGDETYTRLVTAGNTALSTPLVGHTNPVWAVAFSPDGRTLATTGEDRSIRLWNVSDPTRPVPLGQPLTGHTDAVYSVVFSPDGRTVASASFDWSVRLWNASDPTRPAPVGQPLTGHTDTVWAVTFSPDGHTLASTSEDGSVRLWNVSDPTLPVPLGQPLTGHAGAVLSVAFSPDGHTLASTSRDQSVRLWSVSDPTRPVPVGQPLTGHTDNVWMVAFSPDGRTLASASEDRSVRLWSVSDPARPAPVGQPLTGHTNDVVSVAFSPDGRTVASASRDQSVRLWNVSDPTRPVPAGQPLTGHTNVVPSATATFSPDGRTLATIGDNQAVRLWNISDPIHPMALEHPLTGHTNVVRSIAFSPDSRTLASTSQDQSVRLWNVSDPIRPMPLGQTLTGHTNTVWAVAFSPDGQILSSASGDQTIRLWAINLDKAIQRICAVTRNTLSIKEWQRYVGAEILYNPPCK